MGFTKIRFANRLSLLAVHAGFCPNAAFAYWYKRTRPVPADFVAEGFRMCTARTFNGIDLRFLTVYGELGRVYMSFFLIMTRYIADKRDSM